MSQFSKSALKTQYVSKIPVGQSVKLKFEGMVEQVGTPDQFTNEDGSSGLWSFCDEAGAEYAHTHKSAVNALVIPMNKAGIQVGDWMVVTPVMEGEKKRYTVVKSEAPVAASSEPF